MSDDDTFPESGPIVPGGEEVEYSPDDVAIKRKFAVDAKSAAGSDDAAAAASASTTVVHNKSRQYGLVQIGSAKPPATPELCSLSIAGVPPLPATPLSFAFRAWDKCRAFTPTPPPSAQSRREPSEEHVAKVEEGNNSGTILLSFGSMVEALSPSDAPRGRAGGSIARSQMQPEW